MIRLLLLIFTVLFFTSCSRESAPSGSSRGRSYSHEGSGNFGGKAHKTGSRKPPQMGYNARKEKFNLFRETKNAVNYVFASKNKKHKLDNDKRSSSQSYANARQGESEKKTNKSFANKKKAGKGGKGSNGTDKNTDAFSTKAPKAKRKK
jgi:hypothetical protein